MPRVLERTGIDRHSVEGAATRTGIFTSVAASHTRFELLRHKWPISVLWSILQVVSFAAYSKGQTTKDSGVAQLRRNDLPYLAWVTAERDKPDGTAGILKPFVK